MARVQQQHVMQPSAAPVADSPPDRQLFLSEAECRAIAQRVATAATGGGVTAVTIWSQWSGHLTWARNRIVASGDVRNQLVKVVRDIHGATNGLDGLDGAVLINEITDTALTAAVQHAERLARFKPERSGMVPLFERYIPEAMPAPKLFSEATYQLDAERRAAAARTLMQQADKMGVLSAGTIEVFANSLAVIDSLGHVQYVPYTEASYSVTVRDPQAAASGWAGVDWPDWSRVDATTLTDVALEKCLQSRHPVAVEPGRYTTILEPQAVSDFVGQLFRDEQKEMDRKCTQGDCPYTDWTSSHTLFTSNDRRPAENVLGETLIGQRIVDPRISIWSDPMDPDLGFPPLEVLEILSADPRKTEVFHAAQWIKDGVLTQLPYDRDYGLRALGQETGLPMQGAFRMSGGETSVAEMISTTKRGLLVTRFDAVALIALQGLLYRGYTRDGFWLIENGKISKAIKNMVFTESIMFALNNVEQLGVPQRAFNPLRGGRLLLSPTPSFVPALKIKDFSFTSLTEAI